MSPTDMRPVSRHQGTLRVIDTGTRPQSWKGRLVIAFPRVQFGAVVLRLRFKLTSFFPHHPASHLGLLVRSVT